MRQMIGLDQNFARDVPTLANPESHVHGKRALSVERLERARLGTGDLGKNGLL